MGSLQFASGSRLSQRESSSSDKLIEGASLIAALRRPETSRSSIASRERRTLPMRVWGGERE